MSRCTLVLSPLAAWLAYARSRSGSSGVAVAAIALHVSPNVSSTLWSSDLVQNQFCQSSGCELGPILHGGGLVIQQRWVLL